MIIMGTNMQILYNCKHYKQNDNLNLTCQKFDKRCILRDGNANCIHYDDNNISCLDIDCAWCGEIKCTIN